jgi:hypothetical protein
MSVIVQVQLPDDLKSAIDRQVAGGHAESYAYFLRETARLYAEELDADEDLWSHRTGWYRGRRCWPAYRDRDRGGR